MKKSVFFLMILMFFASNSRAQNNIRISTGFAGFGNPFDGFYYSCDIDIKTFKGIQIAPVFTYETSATGGNIYYYQNKDEGEQSFKSQNNSSGGKTSSLIELFVIINPFKYFKNKKLTDLDFGIGAGYGINFFTDLYYNIDNRSNELAGTIQRTGNRESLSFRLFYNYQFKKFSCGIIAGATDILGEGVSIIGVQFSKAF